MAFLPITKQEVNERNWDEVDFVLVTGDAYVDHPSFGTAIISRVLEDEGMRVAILSQPDWKSNKDFTRFGKPRLGFMVNSGNVDSMVAHYTAAKKKRSEDAYSPGGKAGLRPDRALIVYCKKIREIYGNVPIIVGGLEASLRRFAGYDYWKDAVMPSVLEDCGADLLSFGMGENQTRQIVRRLNNGEPVASLTDIKGTCYMTKKRPSKKSAIYLPSFKEITESKKKYAESCRIELDEQDAVRGRPLIQEQRNGWLVQNQPMPPLTTKELDEIYELPFERTWHPSYDEVGGVPAIAEVEFSITHNRGCFGACNFCSIAFHQGRAVTCRSRESIMREAQILTQRPNFKGYIHDLGGPTANFRVPSCEKQKKYGLCPSKKCLAPTPCKQLKVDHSEYLSILKDLRALPKVKKVFIRSGIRYDYLLLDKDNSFFKELVEHHVSGQLKVAPEHCSAAVLDKMGKPHIESYKKFAEKYFAISKKVKKEQYLVPYLMSSHPGSTLKDSIELALFLKEQKLRPQQVQDFYPTPGTISTCMFYTEIDPYTMKKVYVPKTKEDKAEQRALLQYFRPENRQAVIAALTKAGRKDLIGNKPGCLIAPASIKSSVKKSTSSQKFNSYKKCAPSKKTTPAKKSHKKR
ncbi:MAG: YgiQ family radical SAM protein [Ruminococcaceae bacterium]|nr:YgiQ family radical SAM protein [Oscillospiraceae bacterium]